MTASAPEEHKKKAAQKGPVRIAVVTVSDSRTPETDTNGQYLTRQIRDSGHTLVGSRIVPDEPSRILETLDQFADGDCQIILFNGGTGISTRDTTYDVLEKKLEKVLTGFGELFRMLSYDQVGSAAMLSRATAGVYRNRVIISTPGSPKAVELAWRKLILPELEHLAWEVTR